MTNTTALTHPQLHALASISAGYWATVPITTEKALRALGMVGGPQTAPHVTVAGEAVLATERAR